MVLPTFSSLQAILITATSCQLFKPVSFDFKTNGNIKKKGVADNRGSADYCGFGEGFVKGLGSRLKT